MTDRRPVWPTYGFFEDLDRQLGSERGPNGEPSTADFQTIELLRIVDRFAEQFDDLPELIPVGLGNPVATGVRTGVLRILRASVRNISSKTVDELAPAVTHESAGGDKLDAVAEEQIPRCLGGPRAGPGWRSRQRRTPVWSRRG